MNKKFITYLGRCAMIGAILGLYILTNHWDMTAEMRDDPDTRIRVVSAAP